MDVTITIGSWIAPLLITVIGFIAASVKGKAESTSGMFGDLPLMINMIAWLIFSLITWLTWALWMLAQK
jgi:hypothetical protein